MVMGTASHVGKSVFVAALCRIFRQDGYKVSPFKAQNMSRNSAVTPDGREISRAQAMQAEAAGIPPHVDMNPILLKPTNFNTSQVVVRGRVWRKESARQYMWGEKRDLWEEVVRSYQSLDQQFDIVVLEGAGSPVELNLKARDIANMRVAELVDAPVILVADIERGGVFASVVGTVSLLNPSERARLRGIVINKFRGDPALFEDGVRILEERTGIPVLGVIPYIPDLWIDEEDSMGVDASRYRSAPQGDVRVAIVLLPHMANFTDFDPLFWDSEVDAFFARRPHEVAGVDAVILPGTKNTLEDLAWLHASGWASALQRLREQGCPVLGICGGYQMLGQVVRDPTGLESSRRAVEGLGWLDMETTLVSPKTTTRVSGYLQGAGAGISVSGYEIHMGQATWRGGRYPALAHVRAAGEQTWRDEGVVLGNMDVIGTYLHGIFDDGGFRHLWLAHVRERKGIGRPSRPPVSMAVIKEGTYDRLAAVVRAHLALAELYHIMGLADDPPRL